MYIYIIRFGFWLNQAELKFNSRFHFLSQAQPNPRENQRNFRLGQDQYAQVTPLYENIHRLD